MTLNLREAAEAVIAESERAEQDRKLRQREKNEAMLREAFEDTFGVEPDDVSHQYVAKDGIVFALASDSGTTALAVTDLCPHCGVRVFRGYHRGRALVYRKGGPFDGYSRTREEEEKPGCVEIIERLAKGMERSLDPDHRCNASLIANIESAAEIARKRGLRVEVRISM